jgi:PAS domain S-box-containing protein
MDTPLLTPAALQAEVERLRQRERHLMHLLDSARDAVVAMGADGRITDWNPGAERLLGWPAGQAVGQRLSELIVPPEHRAAHERGLQRYLQTRQSQMFNTLVEVEALRRDGSRMPCELSIWPIEGAEQLAFGAFLRDITERRQVETQLRQTMERYRSVVEQLGEGMMVIQHGRIVFANPQASQVLQLPASTLVGMSALELLHPDDQAAVADRLATRQSGQALAVHSEIRQLLPDGGLRWLGTHSSTAEWEGLPATMTFFTDISERKRLEERLTRTLQERETILQSSVVGIAFLTPDGRLRWANPALLQLFGATGSQHMQTMEVVYQSREQYLQVGAAVAQAIGRGESYQTELQLNRFDGQPIWVSLSGKAVSDRDMSQGTVWTVADINERKRAEQEMALALEQQRELNALRSRFVAMTSHEFRTPLASILSSAELLRYYGERMSAEERAEMTVSIEKAVHRMTRMIDRVLQIGKGEAQMLEFAPQPIADMHALCHGLVEEANASFTQSGHTWRIEVEPALSGRAFDEKLLRHALGNLLSNAIKYSPGGGELRFSAGLDAQGRPEFQVVDCGIGIPADEIPHLFESFHRASNVGDIGGTGLGLAIVKKAVELHGGQIRVDSVQGSGTTFTVVL